MDDPIGDLITNRKYYEAQGWVDTQNRGFWENEN